ncbi:DUF1064 domain-containing protein [Paenibacillus koleovorans]|uniref:DUF1064 domain-containing protein n=1 Tax=Paenibacillus koleovorans TaxID=121608 RepID=UPI001FEA8C73|nr:DUF1064 domain-containing protein [Paenibacillus koleovorans]
MSIEEYRALTGGKAAGKPSKMRNVITTVDGIKFSSRAEANRYCELKLMMDRGIVKVFVRQPRFLLQEGYEKDGEWFGKIEYVADFMVCYINGQIDIEDVKGRRTREYIDKRKLFERKYPHLRIVEVAVK